MSTNFEVHPKSTQAPTFRELLDLASVRLNEFLEQHGIDARPVISATLLSTREDKPRPFDLDFPARWGGDKYAWFSIEGVPGGTDAYCWPIEDGEDSREMLFEEITPRPAAAEKKELIEACLNNTFYWSFRRSAGQPAIINVAYGIIAASLAELTEGFVYTSDGAWDYERFPATAPEFFSWYFRPELAIRSEHAEWATRCLELLPEELKPKKEKKKWFRWLS